MDPETMSHDLSSAQLPSYELRQTNSRNTSVSSGSSSVSSSALSDTDFDFRGAISSDWVDSRPRWLKTSATAGKYRLEFLSRTLYESPLFQWAQGPSRPRPCKIGPICPQLQSLPTCFLSRYARTPTGEVMVTCCLCLLWLVVFSATLARSKSISPPDGPSPIRLDCTSTLWRNASACGTDGTLCHPFEGASFSFICPADCARVQVLEPHTVGDQEIIYRNFVIGGQQTGSQDLPVYRGDSFICAAAVHAGIASNTRGGCGILNRQGMQSGFPSTTRNGITSIAFDPSFPLSFSLDSSDVSGGLTCTDVQWPLFGVSLIVTVLISLLATPPALFSTTVFVISFFQIALVSDSPYFPDFASVISLAFERFLPAAFVVFVIYRYCIRRTLTGMKAYWERTVLWLSGYWVGALNDYTFDRIPISRLTPHDLQQQPGAIVALLIILAVILLAAVGQIWAFRIEGRLLRYLGFYTVLAVLIACLIAVPSLNFRLHHYTIGLLLVPGTSVQTRPSLLYQGILLGLFVNGVARWGFASILQTTDALRGDGQLGSALPTDVQPIISSDTISLAIAKLAEGFDGLSILVNDAQRFQRSNVSLPVIFNWTRTAADESLFFRFAFTGTHALGGTWYGDYTKPGTWLRNGTWIDMLPGPSK